MAKRESTFGNMVIVLFLVTLISGGALGFVYDMTGDAIEIAKLNAQKQAIESVLPEFDELKEPQKIMPASGSSEIELYQAFKDGKQVGTAIKTYSDRGFSGNIQIMIGIDTQGRISGYQVLEHKETPGLGSKMEVWFNNADKPNQYIIGKKPGETNFSVSKDGGDIDAITASTITSRAFLDAILRAYSTFGDEFSIDAQSSATDKSSTDADAGTSATDTGNNDVGEDESDFDIVH
ncbi:MAG: RnfABCDGE type electron transport complex subunit G [Prolixibacteraceae bacterium]|nr:RnfABCDGE type electron transport complex subunit G [Prolixibacteraceae bacterium]